MALCLVHRDRHSPGERRRGPTLPAHGQVPFTQRGPCWGLRAEGSQNGIEQIPC